MLLKSYPVSAAMGVIGGKWKPLILVALKDGPAGFGHLRRRVPEASQKVLTEQLRQLVGTGVVERQVVPGRVVRTRYELTEHGRMLRPVLAALAEWGAGHRRHGGGGS